MHEWISSLLDEDMFADVNLIFVIRVCEIASLYRQSPWQSINIPFNCKDLLLFQICSLIISFSRFSIAFFRIRMRNNCCIGIFPNTTACFKPNRPHCESPTTPAVIHGNPRLCQGQATAQDGRILQKELVVRSGNLPHICRHGHRHRIGGRCRRILHLLQSRCSNQSGNPWECLASGRAQGISSIIEKAQLLYPSNDTNLATMIR